MGILWPAIFTWEFFVRLFPHGNSLSGYFQMGILCPAIFTWEFFVRLFSHGNSLSGYFHMGILCPAIFTWKFVIHSNKIEASITYFKKTEKSISCITVAFIVVSFKNLRNIWGWIFFGRKFVSQRKHMFRPVYISHCQIAHFFKGILNFSLSLYILKYYQFWLFLNYS